MGPAAEPAQPETTLYAALAQLNTHERKLMTIEDPIEFSSPAWQQVQVQYALV